MTLLALMSDRGGRSTLGSHDVSFWKIKQGRPHHVSARAYMRTEFALLVTAEYASADSCPERTRLAEVTA